MKKGKDRQLVTAELALSWAGAARRVVQGAAAVRRKEIAGPCDVIAKR
jgi:hypothetical protein